MAVRRAEGRIRGAFALDAAAQAAKAAAKAVWWTAAGGLARAMTRPARGVQVAKFASDAPPVRREVLRAAYLSAFEKDARDVGNGLYPAIEDAPTHPGASLRKAADFIFDARAVDQRRRRGDGVEVREQAKTGAYPSYYRQNFHYQSGGWFTADSARRYDAQVEALFSGAGGAMRRRALSLLARHWRRRDQRSLRILDLACGAGGFLRDLKAAFPRAALAGLDLSPAYLGEARSRSGVGVIQANAELLPFADGALDGVSCIYLFHELPPRVRPVVAASIARVLNRGGVLAFADSIQPADAPELARMLGAFPAYFHEPYYSTYAQMDLAALFSGVGLRLIGEDRAFLTKALLFEKR